LTALVDATDWLSSSGETAVDLGSNTTIGRPEAVVGASSFPDALFSSVASASTGTDA
jgi:hypothetical protein